MGKKKSRQNRRTGERDDEEKKALPLSEKEVEKSNLGLVFWCPNRQRSDSIDWYKVDLKGPATRLSTLDDFPVEGCSCAIVGSKLIVVGGFADYKPSDLVFCLDKDDGWKWTRLPSMISARCEPVVVPYQNRVYVFGSKPSIGVDHISDYGEYLDLDMPSPVWKAITGPPFGAHLSSQFYYYMYAAFVMNTNGEDEIVLGPGYTRLTFSLSMKTHQWADRAPKYPNLAWLDVGQASVVVVGDILLLKDSGRAPIVRAYHLKENFWFLDPVAGLQDYPDVGFSMFQSPSKQYVSFLLPPPTYCLTFHIQTSVDSQGVHTVSALLKSKIGPFVIDRYPVCFFPLGDYGEEEEK